jgi:Outer membrane protein beta-barrel domain
MLLYLRKKMYMRVLMFCLLFFASFPAWSQSIFEGGLVGGFNAAQIEGDYLAGYNKLGGWGGLRVATTIRPKDRLVLEMLYSMRGARSGRYEAAERQSINTRYVEIPLLLQHNDWEVEEDGETYYRAQFYGGFSFGRLINAKTTEQHFRPIHLVKDDFNQNDLSFIFGFSFLTSKHIAYTARYTRSLLPLYNSGRHNLEETDPKVESLFGYHLGLGVMYIF